MGSCFRLFFSGRYWAHKLPHKSFPFFSLQKTGGVLVPILPRNLTWNLKMMVSKRNHLFQGLLFRFHVKNQGCKHPIWMYLSSWKTLALKFQPARNFKYLQWPWSMTPGARNGNECRHFFGAGKGCFYPLKTNEWHWKIHHLKIYLVFENGIFRCHVSFQGCSSQRNPNMYHAIVTPPKN